MARLGAVCQGKRRDPVLQDIGECKQPTLAAHDAPQLLRDVGVVEGVPCEAKDLVGKGMPVLLVTDILQRLGVDPLAESEGAFCYVLAVIVVDSRGADAFILEIVNKSSDIRYCRLTY